MSLPTICLDTLLTGRAQPFTRPGTQSAIDKQPRHGQLKVATLGLHGDEQGDLRVHGGVEKAIHHYPLEHYARWADELGAHPLLMQPGAFGEPPGQQGQGGGEEGEEGEQGGADDGDPEQDRA